MEEKFGKWLIEKEHKAIGTVYSYTNAIKKISEHYSQFQGKRIYIFDIEDETKIEPLIELYDFNGKHSDFGNKGHRTYINALKTYLRFLKRNDIEQDVTFRTTKNIKIKSKRIYSNSEIQEKISVSARKLSDTDLEKLCLKDYSKITFNINFPLFLKVPDHFTYAEKSIAVKDEGGMNRWTWKYEIKRNGYSYAISTQWYPRNDEFVQRWLRKFQ
ncbi:hypothetical protein ACFPH8_05485 [Bizionia hallyeonensis]|uniref:Core-binding (CB) domain-containing protein n=1 Tax=Bizionia hallyeonensis TaxID=1123757 RepID=A0ABW0C682_9FLAO